MSGVDLLHPDLAWLSLLGPAALGIGALGLAWRRRAQRALVAPARLARFLVGYSHGRAWARLMLASLALVLLGIAALGPVRGSTLREVPRTGIDLVVCIDTSRSMLARDLKPSRLDRAKREVQGLLERLRDDRMALIAFSGDARDVAPLTRDRVSLAGFLALLSPADNEKGGTDLAAALSKALALFDGRTGAHEAVVLLTDGEDLEGRASALAADARERGIQVFVVGVGTQAGGKIPLVNERGEESFLEDESGAEVLSRLDRATLEQVAATTGGAYLSVEESATPLEDLYLERITRLEGRELEGGKERVPHDRYQWPLALALLCMLGEAGLRERRNRGEVRP